MQYHIRLVYMVGICLAWHCLNVDTYLCNIFRLNMHHIMCSCEAKSVVSKLAFSNILFFLQQVEQIKMKILHERFIWQYFVDFISDWEKVSWLTVDGLGVQNTDKRTCSSFVAYCIHFDVWPRAKWTHIYIRCTVKMIHFILSTKSTEHFKAKLLTSSFYLISSTH